MADKHYMGPISLDALAELIKTDLKDAMRPEVDASVVAEAIESYLSKNPIEYSSLKGKPEAIKNSSLQEVLK